MSTNKEYQKPDLYLFLQHVDNRTSTESIEVHIVKVRWEEYNKRDMIICADKYDFTPSEYDYKDTRFFDAWNPLLYFWPIEDWNTKEREPDKTLGDGRPSWRGYDILDLYKAESIYKTLKSLNSALDKIAASRGYTDNYIDSIMRFGEVCGVKGIVSYNERDGGLVYWTLKDGPWFIKRFFETAFKWEEVRINS